MNISYYLYFIAAIASVVVCSSESNGYKVNTKRSLEFGYAPPGYVFPASAGPWFSKPVPPSQAEITSIIAAAKQASANVLIAQQQVEREKENVLEQQRIAMEKEKFANIAKQKNEVYSAIQRSEASAAAQAVILAQQRLAGAKTSVSEQQRVAAVKEASAAAAIQSAANAAAVEIQRTENLARKLSNVQRNDNAALIHHVSATKDGIIGPISSGGNHFNHHKALLLASAAPWNGFNGGGAAHFLPTSYFAGPAKYPLGWE